MGLYIAYNEPSNVYVHRRCIFQSSYSFVLCELRWWWAHFGKKNKFFFLYFRTGFLVFPAAKIRSWWERKSLPSLDTYIPSELWSSWFNIRWYVYTHTQRIESILNERREEEEKKKFYKEKRRKNTCWLLFRSRTETWCKAMEGGLEGSLLLIIRQ